MRFTTSRQILRFYSFPNTEMQKGKDFILSMKPNADALAFGSRMIHLLILWHQTFTSCSLRAKMKALTLDKCTPA